MKARSIFTIFIFFVTLNHISSQVILQDPKLLSETSSNGQIAIQGYSGPLGIIVPPPTDPGSIGVVGIGFSGVKGEARAEQGYGVWGRTVKDHGKGVYGFASGSNAEGVYGEATGSLGTGVYGWYHGTTGNAMHGAATGIDVKGVFGVCTNGSTGHGGYFIGGYGTYVSPRLGIQQLQPQYPIHVGTQGGTGNGAHVTGGGTWTNGSSRNFKEHFRTIDARDILAKLATIEILGWDYKKSNEGSHIGPTAEDFYLAFGLGDSDKYISTVDADGVALASIQALYQIVQELQKEISVLKNNDK